MNVLNTNQYYKITIKLKPLKMYHHVFHKAFRTNPLKTLPPHCSANCRINWRLNLTWHVITCQESCMSKIIISRNVHEFTKRIYMCKTIRESIWRVIVRGINIAAVLWCFKWVYIENVITRMHHSSWKIFAWLSGLIILSYVQFVDITDNIISIYRYIVNITQNKRTKQKNSITANITV